MPHKLQISLALLLKHKKSIYQKFHHDLFGLYKKYISLTHKNDGFETFKPWEPELVFQNSLSWDAIGSDAWGTSAVLIATEDTGVIFECEGLSVPIIEARAKVMQLAVREHFGLFLARTDKGM